MNQRHDGCVEFCGEPVPVRLRRFGSDLSQRQAEAWRFERERARADAAHARWTVRMAWLASSSWVYSVVLVLLAIRSG